MCSESLFLKFLPRIFRKQLCCTSLVLVCCIYCIFNADEFQQQLKYLVCIFYQNIGLFHKIVDMQLFHRAKLED